MENIKTILSSIRERLEEGVSELKYVDRDWGQLSAEPPSVSFPCALLNIENIDYSQQGNGQQMADVQITVTVANVRASSSLPASPTETAYEGIDELLDRVHGALQLFRAGDYAPLFRTNLKKVAVDSSKECYKITYQTTFSVGHDTGGSRVPAPKVNIHLK